MSSPIVWLAGPVQYRRMPGHWLRWEFVGETGDGVFHRWSLWFRGSPGIDFSVAEYRECEIDDQAHVDELRQLYRRVARRGLKVKGNPMKVMRGMLSPDDLAAATSIKAIRP